MFNALAVSRFMLAIFVPLMLTGCGRHFVWTTADGTTETKRFIAGSTGTYSASRENLGPASEGSAWLGDESATRLVLFGWDVAATDFPDRALARPGGEVPAPRYWATTRELRWQDANSDGETPVPVPFTPGRRPQNAQAEAQSVRMTDIGVCSVRIPWRVTEETYTPFLLNELNAFNEVGDGLAEQVTRGFAEGLVDDGSGRFTAAKIGLDFSHRTNHPPEYALLFSPGFQQDELLLRGHFDLKIRSGLLSFVLPGLGSCPTRDVSVQVRGTFVAEDDGRLGFLVRRADVDMQNFPTGRPLCRRIHGRIVEQLQTTLQNSIGDSIAAPINEALEAASDLFPNGLQRVEALPSGLEFVLAERSDDPGVPLLALYGQCGNRTADVEEIQTVFNDRAIPVPLD